MKLQSMKMALLVFPLIFGACSDAPKSFDTDAVKAEITQMLYVQDTAWNAGDIDAFMEYYIKSEDLRFASGGNINRGWQATLDGYKVRYPDKDAMGKLSFTNVEIKVLSPEYAQVFARWGLERKADNPGGLFTLLVQKIDGKWFIVSDHTSSD